MTTLSQDEIRRYSRHLVMPEVSREGQERLKDARVLCIGAGGLGSPLGLYLAAAGVGTLGLVDDDVVDISNIQRQVLYDTDDVGRPKLEAAAERLSALNPHVTIQPHPVRLVAENVMDLVADYDLVIDGTDNFPTRYLVNDACVLSGKPNVYGSVLRFDGQVSVFHPQHGPCYRCLFPEPPPSGAVPSCAEGGVVGVMPGIIGSLQALEAIKLILGEGRPLIGRLVLVDALSFEFREVRVARNPDCPVCGDSPSISAPADLELACDPTEASDDIPWISVEAFHRLQRGSEAPRLLDVRNPPELSIARMEGAVEIPLAELKGRLDELDPAQSWVITCHKGARASKAFALLKDAGFTRLQVLEGGIDAWAERIENSLSRYE